MTNGYPPRHDITCPKCGDVFEERWSNYGLSRYQDCHTCGEKINTTDSAVKVEEIPEGA